MAQQFFVKFSNIKFHGNPFRSSQVLSYLLAHRQRKLIYTMQVANVPKNRYKLEILSEKN